MKRILMSVALLGMAFGAFAQPASDVRPSETVLLYASEFGNTPDPIRGEKITCAGFEMKYSNGVTCEEQITPKGDLSYTGDLARLDMYYPEKPNGQLIIVCQGGGYSLITSYGAPSAAEWMLDRGITVAALKYRLPYGHPDVLTEDVHNAMRYCRAHASEWGVNQIGLSGTSAGGYLSGIAALMYDDEITRPDFAVLIYPVVTLEDALTHKGTRDNTIGKPAEALSREGKSWEEWNQAKKDYDALVKKFSLDNQVSPDNPPIFIALSADDRTVNPENGIGLYRALIAAGVPSCELHVFPYGGHGWGFAAKKNEGTSKDGLGDARFVFSAALDRWLASIKK